MANATGKTKEPPVRVSFDRRIKLEFHGARITSDCGLLAYRELDDAFGLTTIAAWRLAEGRRGRNIRHRDLLPVGPAAAVRVLVVHTGSRASMVAGARRSWSGLRSRAPAARRCAASGVRPPWAECGRTRL